MILFATWTRRWPRRRRSNMGGDDMAAKIGYLGPAGTFSEEAANKYLAWRAGRQSRTANSAETAEKSSPVPVLEPGTDTDKVPYPSLPDLFEAVEAAEVTLAVVPGENSLEGSVILTWDLLAETPDLTIVGEFVLPVRHNLLAPAGTGLADIREVLSHPQALGQCRRFLRAYLPAASTLPTASTAEAASLVAGGGGRRAAIGTETAARIYGLDVVARDIQDVTDNFTRFLVLGRTELAEKAISTVETSAGDPARDPASARLGNTAKTGAAKTSLVFSTHNRPGSLYEILREFAERDINLTRIESRPARRLLGEYLFFVDAEGRSEEPRLAAAIAAIRQRASLLRVFGSYTVCADI